MKYWLGAAVLPFAFWLLWQALGTWQRVKAARAAMPAGWDPAAEADTDPLSLAGIGEMVLPLVLAALVFSAVQCIAIYRMMDGGRVLTLFDLAAALFTMAAYGINLTVKVKCRMPKPNISPVAGHGADVSRLRQPYAPDSLNKTYNNQQDWASVVKQSSPGRAALEQTP